MAELSKYTPKLKKYEGGFVNDPDDLGGATNMGITMKTYERYCKHKGYPKPTIERLKNLPEEQWEEIIRTMYWDKCHADEITSQSVAEIIVDWYVNAGTYAIKHVQRVVGTKADGVIGPKTIAAINSISGLPLFGMLKAERKRYYKRICVTNPKNKKFLNGWLNRTNDFNYED